jgi:hypothetical protein
MRVMTASVTARVSQLRHSVKIATNSVMHQMTK